jgi:hypothetical protein
MGYLARKSKTARMMSTLRSPSPMAGFWDDLPDSVGGWLVTLGTNNAGSVLTQISSSTNDATQQACIKQADASGSVKQLDAAMMDISQNWQPSGFYTPDQITQVVLLIQANLLTPLSAIKTAPQSTSDAADIIQNYVSKIDRDMGLEPGYQGTTAKTFTDAAAAARAQGKTVVEAPGLKRWVVNTLQDALGALVAASVLSCNTTILDDVNRALVSLGGFLKSIGNLVVGAAEAVFAIPDTISTIWKVAKYGAIAGAGYLIWKEFVKGKF